MKVGDANALNCHTIILMEGQAKKIHEIAITSLMEIVSFSQLSLYIVMIPNLSG